MKRKFYFLCFLFLSLTTISSRLQAQTGNYLVDGYFFHPTASRIIHIIKTLEADTVNGQVIYKSYAGDSPARLTFSLDSTNQIINCKIINGSFLAGGLMTADNPGNFSYYPDTTHGYTSDVYNNTYDPATYTFYMHYGYNFTGDSITGQTSYTRQIYEKWRLIPKPVIASFSPAAGTRGTEVTIKGSGLRDASEVRFSGLLADSFWVVSDSEVVATAGGGRTGLISLFSTTQDAAEYTTYSADSFFYTPPVVHDTSWHPAGTKGFSAGAADYVSIAMDTAGLPYVAYRDEANHNAATVMHLDTDSIWKVVGGQPAAGSATFTNIAIGSNNVPYLAYIDSATVNGSGISVRRFFNGNWQAVGAPAADTVAGPTYANHKALLALDGANQPYVLGSSLSPFGEYIYRVSKFNGTSWETVGGTDVGIHSGIGDASLAIDKLTNTIYVVSDNVINAQAIVARYRPENGYWDTIPSGYITNGAAGAYDPNIAVSKSGTPYLSFQDDNGPERVSVYSLAEDHFSPYGNKYFSGNHAYNISLAITEGGVTPFVFYTDGSFNGSGTVMTPNINGDGSWQYLGSRGFASSVSLSHSAIATDKTGIPYVAFADSSNGYKATVLKYVGYDLFAPRTNDELYSDSACHPWATSYPEWMPYYSRDTTGMHIEMQTQFQDAPGSLCGFQSYVDTAAGTVRIEGDSVVIMPRNYRIFFSGSPFAHPAGVRLYATAAEVEQMLARANANPYGGSYDRGSLVIYRYDGPNEDYRIDNNQNYHTSGDSTFLPNYTRIVPTVHYYGANNEYCYFEFYTNRFSEFYIGIPINGVLPVHLLSFSAVLQNRTAVVSWQTSNEVNASYYTVQRSTDGIHFINAGKVAAVNAGGSHSYRFSDDLSLLSGIKVYYRLQTTDKDGSNTTSSIVSVSLGNNKLITIQPNPANRYVVINCSIAGTKTITIMDMSGRKILVKTTANSSERIALSSFAKGTYFVRTHYVNGYDVQKLVVE